MLAGVSLAFAACVLAAFPPGVWAAIVEEIVDLPVAAIDRHGNAVAQTIKLTVFRDDRRGRAPFLVLNHGRAYLREQREQLGRVRMSENARYFVSRGFAVFVPTRIGYGASAGPDVEDTGSESCTRRNYPPGYEAGAKQTLAVIAYARHRTYVDASRGVVAGQSFGGTIAIAIAAKSVPGVLVGLNFAGGGGGNPVTHPGKPCRSDLLAQLFGEYGKTSRIPTLWLYSANDKYLGSEPPRRWFEAFRASGGVGEFVALPALPAALGDDGHSTFSRNPAAWRPAVERFLARHGL